MDNEEMYSKILEGLTVDFQRAYEEGSSLWEDDEKSVNENG